MTDRDHDSSYNNEDFYGEYTEKGNRHGDGKTLMILAGEVHAEGHTTHEAQTYDYPGSVDTKLKDVSFKGTLTLYPYTLSDGVDMEVSVLGTEALELLEMFGWEPEEYEWEEDDHYDECVGC